MHSRFSATLCAVFLLVASVAAGLGKGKDKEQEEEEGPGHVFFDTDMETDCDDAGALGVLHALADLGEAKILATVVSVRDPDSAAAVDAINTYYHRTGLPIGMVKGDAGAREKSAYASKLAAEFPQRFTGGAEVMDATLIYRTVLEEEADHSVVIVTTGYLTNLRHLLEMPAADGHASGLDLVKTKVARWVCMGGNFVGEPAKDDGKLGNVNFQRDAESAAYVVQHWPGSVVFVGREIGSVPSGLSLGECLAKTPAENPVRRAYEDYFGGKLKNRHVADLTAVLYAVRGLGEDWTLSAPGTMDLHADMTFDWKAAEDGKQAYVKKKPGETHDRHVEKVLEELLVRGAGQ